MDTRGLTNDVESYSLAAVIAQDFSFNTNTEAVWGKKQRLYYIFLILIENGLLFFFFLTDLLFSLF